MESVSRLNSSLDSPETDRTWSLLDRNRDGVMEQGGPSHLCMLLLMPGSGQASPTSSLSRGAGACYGLVEGRGTAGGCYGLVEGRGTVGGCYKGLSSLCPSPHFPQSPQKVFLSAAELLKNELVCAQNQSSSQFTNKLLVCVCHMCVVWCVCVTCVRCGVCHTHVVWYVWHMCVV